MVSSGLVMMWIHTVLLGEEVKEDEEEQVEGWVVYSDGCGEGVDFDEDGDEGGGGGRVTKYSIVRDQ